MFFAPSKSRQRAKIQNTGVPKTSEDIQINIRMQNTSQEPPASSKAQNQDLQDMDILCTFKIKMESQNFDHGCIKDHIKIKSRMPNPSQEPPALTKALNQDLKDMDILCTFKIKIESQNSDQGCIKDQRPFQNQDQHAKPQSGTPHVLRSFKSCFKGHGCSLHL